MDLSAFKIEIKIIQNIRYTYQCNFACVLISQVGVFMDLVFKYCSFHKLIYVLKKFNFQKSNLRRRLNSFIRDFSDHIVIKDNNEMTSKIGIKMFKITGTL